MPLLLMVDRLSVTKCRFRQTMVSSSARPVLSPAWGDSAQTCESRDTILLLSECGSLMRSNTFSITLCAQKKALVETQITQIAVTPYGNGSATTGKTDLVYTLRLSPKKISDTEVAAYPPCSLNP